MRRLSVHGRIRRGMKVSIITCFWRGNRVVCVPLFVFSEVCIHVFRVHAEPISDVLFTREAMFTACMGGQVKAWKRPSPHPGLRAAGFDAAATLQT
jgi:hypothetical protein